MKLFSPDIGILGATAAAVVVVPAVQTGAGVVNGYAFAFGETSGYATSGYAALCVSVTYSSSQPFNYFFVKYVSLYPSK